MAKPVCTLSLDLDNQWSYMKTHGDAGWEAFPSYLDLVVPRIIELLDQFGWKITVFVVGQDAALQKNHQALQMIAEAGHEIGNHSFNHEPWLHLYSDQDIDEEISRAEEAIEAATGLVPRGFRGPGFSFSNSTLQVLRRRGYSYDASTFPTFLGPLARAYYFMTSSFSKDEQEKRKALFGGFKEGFRPNKPYHWGLGEHHLLEIPVTTMPGFRLPIHFSYLLYISTFSVPLANLYFRTALALCRVSNTEPSLLLHPLDFLGGDDVSQLAFFPAMNLNGEKKCRLLARFFGMVSSAFSVASLGDYAKNTRQTTRVRRA